MLAVEIIALIGVLFGGGISVTALYSWIERKKSHDIATARRLDKMHDDLRAALQSRDYRRLDDWLVLWEAECSSGQVKYIKQRRDELYIEADNKPFR